MGQPLPTTSDPIDEQRILAAGNEIWHIETRHDVAAASRRNAQGPDILSIRTLGARLAPKKAEIRPFFPSSFILNFILHFQINRC
jgi:hypothetical protein